MKNKEVRAYILKNSKRHIEKLNKENRKKLIQQTLDENKDALKRLK